MLWLTIPTALATGWVLDDVGAEKPGVRVVIVCTPGVPSTASLPWAHAFEKAGLDAWTVELLEPDQTVDQAVQGLAEVLRDVPGDWVLAAHGYGGVLALLAEPRPTRMALVGTPLSAHVVPPMLRDPGAVVSEGMPYDPSWVGDLPSVPYSGHLGTAYASWATDFPEYRVPAIPTLVIASNIDPIAPPEVTRLPSLDWPARSWHRAGMLGVAEQDLTHAQLLTHPRTARMVARFLVDP